MQLLGRAFSAVKIFNGDGRPNALGTGVCFRGLRLGGLVGSLSLDPRKVLPPTKRSSVWHVLSEGTLFERREIQRQPGPFQVSYFEANPLCS